jgi:hypothetical protein
LTLAVTLRKSWNMPRPLRIQYAGACYHLMSRGDRREVIFADDADRRQFIATLGVRNGLSVQTLTESSQELLKGRDFQG